MAAQLTARVAPHSAKLRERGGFGPGQAATSQQTANHAFSSLLLIDEDAFARGMARLEADLARGPIPCVSPYTLIWGTLPA